MHALPLALALAVAAPPSALRQAQGERAAMSRADLDRAADAFARANPGARLVRAANGGLEHASGFAAPRVTGNDEANARAFLDAQGRAFGVATAADLQTVRVWGTDGQGGTAVFERTVDGLPVFGGRVAVGWRGDGAITLVNGARVLAAEPRGSFETTADDAIATALAAAPGRAAGATATRGWLQYEGLLQPVFRVEHHAVEPFDAFVSYVAGDTGELLYRVSRKRSATALPGCAGCVNPPCVCAYPDSPIAPVPTDGAPVNTPQPLPARDLDGSGRLNGRRTATFNCLGGDANPSACTGQLAIALDGSFAAAPDATMRGTRDAFAEQSAYYHIDDHSRFLDSLDDGCLATSQPAGSGGGCFAARTPAGGVGFVAGYVNAQTKGAPLENAYFSSSGGPAGASGVMILGQGALVDLAYDAEIVYHELTHAAVEVTAALEELTDRFGANSDPGSLNEGTADTFAVAHTAETLAPGSIDSASCISSYFAASLGRPCLRQALNGRTCGGNGPNDGRNPGRDGEVHDDGEIWTGFAWSLLAAAHEHELRPQVAAAMFKALEAVGPHPTFEGYAATVRQKMSDAGLPQEALDFADCTIVQRDLAGCKDRAVALFSGERALGGFFGVVGRNGTTTAGQQYFVDVPCGAVALHLRTGDSTGRGRLLVRRGAPIEFATAGLGSPAYDWLVSSNQAEVVLDVRGCAACACSGSQAAFGPGRWYLLPTGSPYDAGNNTNVFELGVSIEMPPGQSPPQRVPYTFAALGASNDANACVWGVTGAVPANRIPPNTAPASLAGCTSDVPPTGSLACSDSKLTATTENTGCGCSTAGPDAVAMFAAALLVRRLIVRSRCRRVRRMTSLS